LSAVWPPALVARLASSGRRADGVAERRDARGVHDQGLGADPLSSVLAKVIGLLPASSVVAPTTSTASVNCRKPVVGQRAGQGSSCHPLAREISRCR